MHRQAAMVGVAGPQGQILAESPGQLAGGINRNRNSMRFG